MGSPVISVVIPTYNRIHMLEEAVMSVLSQTYADFEVIVVDDGSSDGTEDVIRKIADSRVKYIWQENAGISSARNLGIELSKGEYITFLDSDDIFLPYCLKEKIDIISDYPSCVLVGGGCSYFNNRMEFDIIPKTPARSEVSYEDLCIFTAFPGGSCNIFTPAKVLRSIGGFNDQLPCAEDRDLLRRLSKKGEIKFSEKSCVAIRIHNEDRPNRDFKKVLAAREYVSMQIPELNLRLRSRAWNYMVGGFDLWKQSKHIRALGLWIYSFVLWPFPIHPELPRIRPIVRDYLLKN